jgi:hypothetical protein
MHKNVTKCNKTQRKWCINKHGASKIIDTFETYQQPMQMNVNCSEIMSVSQLVDIFHAKIPWGSRHKAKFVWMNMNQVYKQLQHYHQLLQIWEKYNGTHQLDLFAIVDDIDAPEAQFGAKGADPEGGATSGLDVCKLAAVDHSHMYLIALQVDLYT